MHRLHCQRLCGSGRYQILLCSYLPLCFSFWCRVVLLRFDVQVVGHFVGARDFSGLGGNGLLLGLGVNRSLQRDLTVLRDDLDVVGVGRQRFVTHDGLTNLLRTVAVRTIFLLLVGGRFILILISLIHLGIVDSGSRLVVVGVLRVSDGNASE